MQSLHCSQQLAFTPAADHLLIWMKHALRQSLRGPWQHLGHHTGRTPSAGQCSSSGSSSSRGGELLLAQQQLVCLVCSLLQLWMAVVCLLLLLLAAGSWGEVQRQ
jgi:hypothetical protein